MVNARDYSQTDVLRVLTSRDRANSETEFAHMWEGSGRNPSWPGLTELYQRPNTLAQTISSRPVFRSEFRRGPYTPILAKSVPVATIWHERRAPVGSTLVPISRGKGRSERSNEKPILFKSCLAWRTDDHVGQNTARRLGIQLVKGAVVR